MRSKGRVKRWPIKDMDPGLFKEDFPDQTNTQIHTQIHTLSPGPRGNGNTRAREGGRKEGRGREGREEGEREREKRGRGERERR